VELAAGPGIGEAPQEGRLQGPACIEDIDFRATRGLDKQVVRALIHDSDWIRRQSTHFPGGSRPGSEKRSWREPSARRHAAMASRPTSPLPHSCFGNSNWLGPTAAMPKRLRALGQVDALIVDDWAMAPLADAERRAFLEICDERYLTRSTLLTSQLPVAKWPCADRRSHGGRQYLWTGWLHAAHRIELQESRCARREVVACQRGRVGGS